MSDSELKQIVTSTLQSLVPSRKLSPPVSSFHLLTRIIAARPPQSTSPRFKLSDLPRFEAILEDLSRTWEDGSIVLLRDGETLTVVEVCINSSLPDGRNPKKRKRVVDEDADSAAGDENAEEEEASDGAHASNVVSTLGPLSDDLKEVYAILQKATAKGRLLAEQVYSYLPQVIVRFFH
jgi:mRNA (2'-O-methyladenosine-N6-)-methyltransferase